MPSGVWSTFSEVETRRTRAGRGPWCHCPSVPPRPIGIHEKDSPI
ncbi:hypothetical protein HMPREF0043_01180 [Actinobaculum sp. oral taxon 183 str. F0552]|nr:hypothetical protein HMPREF0043_01180 [Actinobaculum sp. oral taxon 183 str. F0552]